jgi:metal-responsive CopG/Arc/MetJ family transcriptional regulator
MKNRLTISLPERTVPLLNRVAHRGQRSSLISRAVRRYVKLKRETRANLRRQLADSYAVNAALDRRLAEDWFPIEQEASDRARRRPHSG